MTREIYALGDIHGKAEVLNFFLEPFRERDVVFLQCGDFGFFWPKAGMEGKIRNGRAKIYWCPGNHEDYSVIRKDGSGFIEVDENIYLASFGSVLELEGRNILFAGGAESPDRKERIYGESWWPEESISESDMEKLPDAHIDWVISHTAPWFFPAPVSFFLPSPSRSLLNRVFDRYTPKRWIFGHFHKRARGVFAGCHWDLLDTIESGRGIMRLA